MRNGTPSVTAEEIIPWHKKEDEVKKAQEEKLYLKFDTKDIDLFGKVTSALRAYPGDTEVVIKCTSNNRPFAFNQKVETGNYLLNELYGLLGVDNVKLWAPKQ